MNDPEEKKARRKAVRPASYGGYFVRQNYEKKRLRPWQAPAMVALFLLLFILSGVGLIALLRGGFFPGNGNSEENGVSKVTLPVLGDESKSRASSPEEAVSSAEKALITVELKLADGASRGTGFLITEDGYAVCHSALFREEPHSITVYTGDGAVATADKVGEIPPLGITIIRLDRRFTYQGIALGNTTVRRGQTLYGVSSVSRGTFYGLVQQGTAVSTAEDVTVTVGNEERSIPVLYTSIPFDPTLNGALLITEDGNAVGFLTDSLPGRGGGMAAVPAITLVGLVNEIIN